MPEKIHEFLKGRPDRWTKGTFARDERGACVGSLDPNATCFCVAGLLNRFKVSWKLFCDVTGIYEPIAWNDAATFDEVYEAFRKADL